MAIEFKLEHSFKAELYWHDNAKGLKHRIGASYDSSTPFKNNDGWLHAGKDTYTKYNRAVRVTEVIKMDFWFGCYVKSGQYFYDVRSISLTRRQPFFAARLESSRNGYLGLYIPEFDRNEPPEDALWQLDGFDESGRVPGSGMHGVTLKNAKGGTVKRLYENEFPYLNDRGSGEGGTLTIAVLQVGERYPFPD